MNLFSNTAKLLLLLVSLQALVVSSKKSVTTRETQSKTKKPNSVMKNLRRITKKGGKKKCKSPKKSKKPKVCPFTSKDDLQDAVNEYCKDPDGWKNSDEFVKYG
jgi:hypothetical protein